MARAKYVPRKWEDIPFPLEYLPPVPPPPAQRPNVFDPERAPLPQPYLRERNNRIIRRLIEVVRTKAVRMEKAHSIVSKETGVSESVVKWTFLHYATAAEKASVNIDDAIRRRVFENLQKVLPVAAAFGTIGDAFRHVAEQERTLSSTIRNMVKNTPEWLKEVRKSFPDFGLDQTKTIRAQNRKKMQARLEKLKRKKRL